MLAALFAFVLTAIYLPDGVTIAGRAARWTLCVQAATTPWMLVVMVLGVATADRNGGRVPAILLLMGLAPVVACFALATLGGFLLVTCTWALPLATISVVAAAVALDAHHLRANC